MLTKMLSITWYPITPISFIKIFSTAIKEHGTKKRSGKLNLHVINYLLYEPTCNLFIDLLLY